MTHFRSTSVSNEPQLGQKLHHRSDVLIVNCIIPIVLNATSTLVHLRSPKHIRTGKVKVKYNPLKNYREDSTNRLWESAGQHWKQPLANAWPSERVWDILCSLHIWHLSANVNWWRSLLEKDFDATAPLFGTWKETEVRVTGESIASASKTRPQL